MITILTKEIYDHALHSVVVSLYFPSIYGSPETSFAFHEAIFEKYGIIAL